MTLLESVKKPQISSLNGIRAVSALVVVSYHLTLRGFHGNYGVTMFFVLSGFLITNLLLKEREQTGTVSLKNFYLRRTLRIFPAFYGFVLFYVAVHYFAHHEVRWAETIATLTYTRDYFEAFFYSPEGTMRHTWSLAVEEQFYLLWPFIFCRFKPRELLKGLSVFVCGVWALRFALVHNPTHIYYAFDTRADALALGCLVAIAVHLGYEFRWVIKSWLVGIAAVLGIVALNWRFPFDSLVVYAALPILCAIFLLNAVYFGPRYKLLNNPIANYLGLISYPIYLYHIVVGHGFHGRLHYPASVAAVIIMASLSYFIVEKPFLRLKDRIGKAGSPQDGQGERRVEVDNSRSVVTASSS